MKEEGAKAAQDVSELRAALETARTELAGVKEAKAGLEAEVAGLKGCVFFRVCWISIYTATPD